MDCQPDSRLLALPAEIRKEILAYMLAARHVRYHKGDGFIGYKFVTSIFRVNKQLHKEAVETFKHENTFILVSTPWAAAEEHVESRGQIPVLMRGEAAARFPHVRMMGEVEVPEHSFPFGPNSIFVICREDLEAFCKMWYYSDLSHGGFNGHLKLNLKIKDLPSPANPMVTTRMSRTFQEQLLTPFVAVKGLADIKITGPIDKSVREEFLRRNKEPAPTPEQCLDECETLKSEGNKAVQMKEYERAKTLYEQANEAMYIIIRGRHRQIWGDIYFDKILSSGIFKGQNGNIVRMLLRIKLVSNMIEVFLKLNQPEEAKFWGWRAINLVRERTGGQADQPMPAFPAAGAWGKVYYRTGRACQMLGEEDDARQLFRIAANWLPNDPTVQQARADTALRLG